MPTTIDGVRVPVGSDSPDVPLAFENAVQDLLTKMTALTQTAAATETKLNQEIARLNSEIAALKTADTNLASRVTRTRGYVFSDSDNTTKNAGGSLSNVYSWTWTMPENGHILVVGEAELNDQASVAGDPNCRLVLGGSNGPVSVGGIGKGTTPVTITVPLVHSAAVSKGNLSVVVQAGATTNTPGTIKNCSVRGLFIANV